MGQLSEFVRKLPNSFRSIDPFLSVCAVGKNAEILTTNIANTSFGKNSFFDIFTKMNGKILCLGAELRWATIFHYFEELSQVSHRYKKFFTGKIRINGIEKKISWVYSVRALAQNAYPRAIKLQNAVCKMPFYKEVKFAKGQICAISAKDYKEFALKELSKDSWLCTNGPACDIQMVEKERTGEESFNLTIKDTSIEELSKLYILPRHLVSDGYDYALMQIKEKYPDLKIHSYTSGTQAFTWIVPERWICHKAGLYDMNGNEIFSTDSTPLHVVSYSLPFNGVVSRDELFAHLYIPPENSSKAYPDAIPFIFKYYEKNWGLCCSKAQKDTLKDEFYKVVIDSDFSLGSLKVGELTIKGKSDKQIIFCTHLCHPAQFNDDLSGVIAGLKVMQELAKMQNLNYTYKLLILPETIGSACYLSQNENEIPKMLGGIFLEMLATKFNQKLMLSNFDDSYFEKICTLVALKNNTKIVPFLSDAKNDERMFNACFVPMLSLLRTAFDENTPYLYNEYHTNFDTPQNADFDNLKQSINFVLELINILENDAKFVPNFKGELFVSSVSEIDYYTYQKEIFALNFSKSANLSDIALKTDCDFNKLVQLSKILQKNNLASLEEASYVISK